MFYSKLLKSIKNSQVLSSIAHHISYWLIKFLFATYRIQVTNDPLLNNVLCENNGIFYSWHKNIFAIAAFLSKNNFSLHCIASPSLDGRFLGALTERIGLKVLYGSAHKNPISLVRESIEILKNHGQLFVIGDGSRGPAEKLQPGVNYFSRKTGLPLIFINCKVSKKIVFKKSWDKFQLPLPFSKIYIELKCLSK